MNTNIDKDKLQKEEWTETETTLKVQKGDHSESNQSRKDAEDETNNKDVNNVMTEAQKIDMKGSNEDAQHDRNEEGDTATKIVSTTNGPNIERLDIGEQKIKTQTRDDAKGEEVHETSTHTTSGRSMETSAKELRKALREFLGNATTKHQDTSPTIKLDKQMSDPGHAACS